MASAEAAVLKIGHFPNVTHAPGVIGHGLTRRNNGWFESRLGPEVELRWYVFDRGATAMEAIFAGTIDLAYVGPNPAINAHVRSRGEEIRILAGVCSGGAALVVHSDGPIRYDNDFRGKRVGTPQFGNTQDVAARTWLRGKGFRVTIAGGDLSVVPTSSADQFALFKRGDLDAVWTVEPQVSRLVIDAAARVYLEERTLWPETEGRYAATLLISSARLARESPGLVEKWIRAHVELIQWVNDHPEEAKQMFNEEFKAETGRTLQTEILDSAWKRLEFTYDPVRESIEKVAVDAHRIGFLRQLPDLSRLFLLDPLNAVLRQMTLKEVP